MGAIIFAFLMFLWLIFGGIIFFVYSKVNNKRIKFFLRLILILILGLPVSWIVWLIYSNILNIFYIVFYFLEDIMPYFINNILSNIKIYIIFYLIMVNILGVLGYILYKRKIKKIDDRRISKNEYLLFVLQLNILCDIFPVILLFTE
jgi:hypothetical protein